MYALYAAAGLLAALTAESANPLPQQRIEQSVQAVVAVKVKARADGRSSRELGIERRGSGVVIDREGHVLTNVFLVIDAETIELVTQHGRASTATVVALDHSSGIGVVRANDPLHVLPIRLGSARSVRVRDPVFAVVGGESEQLVVLSYVVAKRPYATGWEYSIDEAILTLPGTLAWEGAALLDLRGELVGIGHLLAFARPKGGPVSALNVFVPIDLVRPVLDELIEHGRRNASQRPWLGVLLVDVSGRVMVAGVMHDGPAERAGLRAGDFILAIAAEPVQTYRELYAVMWRSGAAGVPLTLSVLRAGDVRKITVESIGIDSYYSQEPDE